MFFKLIFSIGYDLMYEKFCSLTYPFLRFIRNFIFLRLSQIYVFTKNIKPIDTADTAPILFIIGCGRSGTTILGNILETHPDVTYWFEPGYLWTAIDKRFDLTNLYLECNANAIIDETFLLPESISCFGRLFLKKKFLIEKTPHNALRIGYLHNLLPKAKFLHIVRDGVKVARSIQSVSISNRYRIAFKKEFNQWWGNKHCKWHFLKRDGKKAGYYPDEVELLTTDLQKAAYEWLVTLHEIEKWKNTLEDKLLEITYDEFVTNTSSILRLVLEFCCLKYENTWLINASQLINSKKEQIHISDELRLPPAMCVAFNAYQQKYGFTSMASKLEI